MTAAEQVLWERLRKRQAGGHKFRRQHLVGKYIVDFYSSPLRLAIEVDGSIHKATRENDELRTQNLRNTGVTVIRFSNDAIETDIDAVITKIVAAATKAGRELR